MNELSPNNTFRGLPLTVDQEREVEHYIHTHQRHGQPWDTPELQAMIADMLNPPEVAGEDSLDDCRSEQETAMGEESRESDLLPCERARQHSH